MFLIGLYWFRAQTIKYLMRPKEWVLEYTERERMKVISRSPLSPSLSLSLSVIFLPYRVMWASSPQAFPNGVIPHPLVSMHVRHGDKYKESFLISLDEYVRALKESGIVEKVCRPTYPHSTHTHILSLSLSLILMLLLVLLAVTHGQYGVKGIFISTEDPKVIEDTYMYPEFNWYWTKVCLGFNSFSLLFLSLSPSVCLYHECGRIRG
jgi:hypothetical protein